MNEVALGIIGFLIPVALTVAGMYITYRLIKRAVKLGVKEAVEELKRLHTL